MKNKKEIIISLNDVIVKTNTRGRTLNVIKNISFDIYTNEILAIVGKSNTGKTVLTKALSNSLNENSYISNGTIMYYPSQKTIDEGVSSILTPVDLVSYQKSNVPNITKDIIRQTNKNIIDKAGIEIYKIKDEITEMQYAEANRQTHMFKAILDKTVRMSEYEKTQLHSSTYIKDKKDSINNNTSPAMPLIQKLLIKIQKHEQAIDKAHSILTSTLDQKVEITQYKLLEHHKNEIKDIKKAISGIQISVANTNYEFMKSIRNDIKFLAINEAFLETETRKASLRKMKYYNNILKLEENEEIIAKIRLIDNQLEIIRRANYELSNYTRLNNNSITKLSLLMEDIELKKNSIDLIASNLIENGIDYLDKQEFLTDFETNLNNLLLKIISEEKVLQKEVLIILEQWKFQKNTISKNKSLANKESKIINAEVISTIFDDANKTLKPNVKVGQQISEIISATHKISKSQAHTKALELMNRMGIINAEDVYNKLPSQCSDTVKQLLAFVKSISSSPKVLIWDESITSLGSSIKNQLLKLILELKNELNLTIIVFTNNFEIPLKIADRIAVINDGEIVEYGNTNEIIENPAHLESKKLNLNIKEIFKQSNQTKDCENIFDAFNEGASRKNYAEQKYVPTPHKFSKITNTHFVKSELELKATRGEN